MAIDAAPGRSAGRRGNAVMYALAFVVLPVVFTFAGAIIFEASSPVILLLRLAVTIAISVLAFFVAGSLLGDVLSRELSRWLVHSGMVALMAIVYFLGISLVLWSTMDGVVDLDAYARGMLAVWGLVFVAPFVVMTVLSGTVGPRGYRGVVLDVVVRGLERKRRRLEGLVENPERGRIDSLAILALVCAPLFPFGIVLARHAMRTVRRNTGRGAGMARTAFIIGWVLPALVVLLTLIVSLGQWHLGWCAGDHGWVCILPGP